MCQFLLLNSVFRQRLCYKGNAQWCGIYTWNAWLYVLGCWMPFNKADLCNQL